MVRKLSVLLGLLFMLVLSACVYSIYTFTFTGETDNWSASLKVKQHSNDYEDQEFELLYKGNDVHSVGDITFDVETNAGGFGGVGYTLSENGVLRSNSNANPTNAKITEDSAVEVTVEWNGNVETITLSND
ncbi:hypothetical protein [Alkalihalobacterium elongatum]|uniref:hypothetical protein n=1 Tax=Alkalihalobacterium elongatum TaxID=2675466 RepID=UPI001C1F84C9|nr:hypothetical protein [Alkalihalobacterium elongatum]